MFPFITVAIVLLFELTLVYCPNWTTRVNVLVLTPSKVLSNCISEKWGLLYDSIRDSVFNVNYRYHVDLSSETILAPDTCGKRHTEQRPA
jgi:hypothetical protein